jgi:hypothetical protein
LIAPSSELSSFVASQGGTTGRYQQFYCGTLPGCFGGGWLTSVESSASASEFFNEMVAQANGTGFFIRPLFGVLLKRWQQSAPGGANTPWDSALGWPIFGPIVYKNFQPQLTPQGTFRALGMWFEHGFVWWVDYDQELYPNAADKALAYFYTGANVYEMSESSDYIKLGSAIEYSDRGPLGVSVVAEKVLSGKGSRYEAQVGEPLQLHAHGFGGLTDNQWRYKHYFWRFGDGNELASGTPFSDDTQYVTYSFDAPGTYTITVQVTDAADEEAYGATLPVIVTE